MKFKGTITITPRQDTWAYFLEISHDGHIYIRSAGVDYLTQEDAYQAAEHESDLLVGSLVLSLLDLQEVTITEEATK